MIALKTPRTLHLVGSGIQDSGDGKDRLDWKQLEGRFVVLEEKIDGTEVSFHFDDDANLIGRERSHAIDLSRRGGNEKALDLFKDWLLEHADTVFERLENRYLVYAEWCAAVHSIYYNRLPSFLIECDVQDKTTGEFLSTERRMELLAGLPIYSAPVLFSGLAAIDMHPHRFLGPSHYTGDGPAVDFRTEGHPAVNDAGPKSVDYSGRMEGIYGKIEENGVVVGRFKYVREDFIRMIVDSGSHWKDRPMMKNRLISA